MKRKRIIRYALHFLLLSCCAQAWGAVNSALISRQVKDGVHEVDPRYTAHDFVVAFGDLNLAEAGEETEDGVFGRPIRLIVRSDEGDFLLVVNNTEGVFSIYRLHRSGKVFKVSTRDSRDVRLPELYSRLKSAELNILSEKNLKAIYKLPRSEGRQFFKDYRPVKD